MSRMDEPPGRFMRLVFRAPIYPYRFGLGRLISKRLLMLTHIGRKSGRPRYAVLEVTRHDETSGAFLVPAAYGRRADWYRNLLENPAAVINHRGRRMEVMAETLPIETAKEEFAAYAVSHPSAAKNLENTMGIPFDDPRAVAERVPLIALRPN